MTEQCTKASPGILRGGLIPGSQWGHSCSKFKPAFPVGCVHKSHPSLGFIRALGHGNALRSKTASNLDRCLWIHTGPLIPGDFLGGSLTV